MLTSSMLFLHEILHMTHTLVSNKIGLRIELQATSKLRFSHTICRKVELLNIYLQEEFINSLIWKCKLCYCILKLNSIGHQNGCQMSSEMSHKTAPTAMKLLRACFWLGKIPTGMQSNICGSSLFTAIHSCQL